MYHMQKEEKIVRQSLVTRTHCLATQMTQFKTLQALTTKNLIWFHCHCHKLHSDSERLKSNFEKNALSKVIQNLKEFHRHANKFKSRNTKITDQTTDVW